MRFPSSLPISIGLMQKISPLNKTTKTKNTSRNWLMWTFSTAITPSKLMKETKTQPIRARAQSKCGLRHRNPLWMMVIVVSCLDWGPNWAVLTVVVTRYNKECGFHWLMKKMALLSMGPQLTMMRAQSSSHLTLSLRIKSTLSGMTSMTERFQLVPVRLWLEATPMESGADSLSSLNS